MDFSDRHGRGLDRYGHGTHVAGIVAAAGSATTTTTGVAPGAHIINLKVLDAHGEGTAGDVIEAIDWAIEHRRRYRIRVINLSLGGTPMQSWRDDPLCQAVERALRAGLWSWCVGGQSREDRGRHAGHRRRHRAGNVPARDHRGRAEHEGHACSVRRRGGELQLAGPTRYDRLIKPDLVAPGNRIRGLLAPGSTLAKEYPELVIGTGRGAHLELSGTSMAAAVVSGAAALAVENSHRASPLAVFAALQHGSEYRPRTSLMAAGAGSLNYAPTIAPRSKATGLYPYRQRIPFAQRLDFRRHRGVGRHRRVGRQRCVGD